MEGEGWTIFQGSLGLLVVCTIEHSDFFNCVVEFPQERVMKQEKPWNEGGNIYQNK